MKHLLNNLTTIEKKAILEQYRSEIKVETENFRKLLKTKSGDIRPISEGFFEDNFGKPDIERASRDSARARRMSRVGSDEDRGEDFIEFEGQKFYPDQIEYASYDDLGDLPRIERGKLIVTNPAWEL